MKKDNRNSKILDGNPYSEKEPGRNFLKIIGFTILNVIAFCFINFVVIASIFPLLTRLGVPGIYYKAVLFVSVIPFIYLFYPDYKNKKLEKGNWERYVAISTFTIIFLLFFLFLFIARPF